MSPHRSTNSAPPASRHAVWMEPTATPEAAALLPARTSLEELPSATVNALVDITQMLALIFSSTMAVLSALGKFSSLPWSQVEDAHADVTL